MKKQKVIIDTDPGIDDALAILLLLKSPQIDVQAITTVAGNNDIQTVTDNAQTILKALGSSVPIYSGSLNPLVRNLSKSEVMGNTSLGNVPRVISKKLNRIAIKQLINLTSAQPKEITIVAIGPLTNIALAMQLDPKFALNIKEIVIMGGAIESYGNMNRVAEFNFFVDPEAAEIVLSSNCKKTLITLDRCYEIPLFRRDFESLGNSKLSNFILSMVIPYIKNLALFEGQDGAIVYDALAAYYVVNPEAYVLQPMDIKIETKGDLTRGMCAVERRLYVPKIPNVNVVMKIDKESFKKNFLRILMKKC